MGTSTVVVVADILLRRLCLPLVLIASAVFRYNVLSLVNFLLFLVSLLLPGPRLKAQKASSLVCLCVLVAWSLLALLGQTVFQVALATNYSDHHQPCGQQEYIWRQFGFILYQGAGVRGVDIVRHLLPDCVVFLTALANLVTSGYIVAAIRKVNRRGRGEAEQSLREEGLQEVSSEGTTPRDAPEYPSHIQCYWQLPNFVNLLFEVCIFILLGFSGVAIPSLTSFTYYIIFIMILTIWSCHQTVKWKGVMRVLRCGMTFYVMMHLTVLYLYQFQAAQQNIPLQPSDTSKSLLARLFGLTALIFTDCEYPTHLQLHPDLEFPVFVNPVFLLLLCLLLATDLRLWINTPDILWGKTETYHLPVSDSLPSTKLKLVSNNRSSSPVQWSHYGTYQIRGTNVEEPEPGVLTGDDGAQGVGYQEFQEKEVEDDGVDGAEAVAQVAKRHIMWQDVKKRVLYNVMCVWHFFLLMSYVPAIVCMMFWSVLYPSWPALLLLLWACTIWLIPRFTPMNSLFYTSPALVVYAVCLLALQYVFSLNLTSRELSPVDGLGQECYESTTPGCKSIVPFIKTAFTVVFFSALHEFVRMRLNKHSHAQDDSTDGENTTPTTLQRMGSELVRSGLSLLSTYWILVVVASFLLVCLSGEPNLLKVVYLIFFFIFLITYQVFNRCWYYVCVPFWWGLVIYAALELILIYTYQFDSVSDAWERAYNNTPGLMVDSDDLFRSIGLRKYGINSLRDLCVSTIPPAVFIAVMAIQLRYFNPLLSSSALVPTLLPSSLSPDSPSCAKRMDTTQIVEEGTESGAAADSHSVQEVTSDVPQEKSFSFFYLLPSYLLKKLKQIIFHMVELFWRILELHLHKVSMLVLFFVVLSEISAGYWVLFALSLLAVPLPYFSSIIYPLITLYIGLLSVIKTIYQFPVVVPNMFNLTTFNGTDDGGECSEQLNTTLYLGNYSGLVYNYQYSSRINDGGWIGLHKVSNYVQYIIGPLSLVLLLSLHFSAKRHETKVYNSSGIVINPWEKGSLFLNVSRKRAETSVLDAGKYLINHFFEMYGKEITFVMMAISVAVRIDMYGVFYCIVLGILLLVPRRLMAPLWLFYTVIHGLLLLLQHSMLLGVPPGVCFYPGGERGYPWDEIVRDDVANFGLKKWLFLSDYPQMLDKTVLYVDFVVYILLCDQVYNFRVVKELCTPLSDFLQSESLINYIKIFVTRYLFWITIFLVFFAAITRVSFLGLLYLLVCFALLYRGQNMLMDRKKRRTMSWAGLRLMALVILLVRVSVQMADCVFYNYLRDKTQCNLILAFNGACNRKRYYGAPVPDCSAYPNNVGLWVDALTFTIFTIQIAVFDTQYSDMLRDYLIVKSSRAGHFSTVLDKKMKERQQKAKSEREKEFVELRERVHQLNSSEDTIFHVLHAGVRIPSGVHLRTEQMQEVVSKEITVSLDDFSASELESVEPKSKSPSKDTRGTDDVAEAKTSLSRLWKFIYDIVLEVFDRTTELLERSSSLYVGVVEELKQQEVSEEKLHVDVGSKVELATMKDDSHSVDLCIERPGGEGEGTVKAVANQPSAKSFPTEEVTTLITTETVHFSKDKDVRPGSAEIEDKHVADFEKELGGVAERYRKRPVRFLKALQNALFAHAEYVIYFLVILNVVLNGSVISLGYVGLLFSWGLLCIPWPTKTFWLSITFYSMLVLVLKYTFQFYDVDYHDENLESDTGFSTPNVLGIVNYHNSAEFFKNAVWDMLLLIALLVNRGLLKQNGLWREYSNKKKSVLDKIKADTKLFYYRLLSPDVSRGAADYYVIMLFFDVLCMVTIIFGISSFGVGIAGEGFGQAASYIQNNYVPLPFIIMLLLQFLSMLVDRAIYLRRALKAKFVFQFFLLLVWHSWLLFVLPSESVTKRSFTMNTAAQCVYFFKCLYFIVSAIQIVSGYPTNILGNFLGRHYTTVSGLLFSVYRAIPLLPELREVMDWVFTDTVLPLFHWLRVQEIYSKLYLVKVRRHREKNAPRDLGDKQSLLTKTLLGGLLLVFLVLLLWGPLLVISFINTTSVANSPVETSISLSLDGYEPLVQISVQQESIVSLKNSEYEQLRNNFQPEVQTQFGSQSNFRKVIFPNESTSLWTISPPAKLLLLNSLISVRENNTSITMQFSWTIQREPVITSASEVVSGSTPKSLNYEENPSTVDNFINTLREDKTDVYGEHFVHIPNTTLPYILRSQLQTIRESSLEAKLLLSLYPRLIYAPATGRSENYTDLSRFFKTPVNIMCNTSLSNTSNQEWWTLDKCTNPIYTDNSGPPILLIYSERIAPQIFSVIAGFGIIGLYVSVVLVIGRLIRNYVSSLPSELLLDEIVNPDPLLKLCSDIFIVRQSRDFKLEEILVGKLFSIFRSPAKLIELTENIKSKQD